MLLVIHYSIGDVQDSQGVSASEMTYVVSGGALNPTHLGYSNMAVVTVVARMTSLSSQVHWYCQCNGD